MRHSVVSVCVVLLRCICDRLQNTALNIKQTSRRLEGGGLGSYRKGTYREERPKATVCGGNLLMKFCDSSYLLSLLAWIAKHVHYLLSEEAIQNLSCRMLPHIVHENTIKVAISQNHSPLPSALPEILERARSVRMSVVLEVSANIWDIRYQSGMDCMRGHDI